MLLKPETWLTELQSNIKKSNIKITVQEHKVQNV